MLTKEELNAQNDKIAAMLFDFFQLNNIDMPSAISSLAYVQALMLLKIGVSEDIVLNITHQLAQAVKPLVGR